jgi:hypothetical protein
MFARMAPPEKPAGAGAGGTQAAGAAAEEGAEGGGSAARAAEAEAEERAEKGAEREALVRPRLLLVLHLPAPGWLAGSWRVLRCAVQCCAVEGARPSAQPLPARCRRTSAWAR